MIYMVKTSRKKSNYLENEKSFSDEIKSIFHRFEMSIIEANKIYFFGGGCRTLKKD